MTVSHLDAPDGDRALGWGGPERRFLIAATMLSCLGIRRLRLLTNNPAKVEALAAYGLEIAGREPVVIDLLGVNDAYLVTQARRSQHKL